MSKCATNSSAFRCLAGCLTSSAPVGHTIDPATCRLTLLPDDSTVACWPTGTQAQPILGFSDFVFEVGDLVGGQRSQKSLGSAHFQGVFRIGGADRRSWSTPGKSESVKCTPH